MAMTGSTMPQTRPLDGRNIWPALRDNQPSPVESYYWVWRDEDAIRTDKWKLHRFFNRFELYDIRNDETESNNVAEAHPEVVQSLVAKMDAWADSMGAAISHQPAPEKYHAAAAPEGEVLAVTVTITDKAQPERSTGDLVRELERHAIRHRLDRMRHRLLARHDRSDIPISRRSKATTQKPFGPLFKPGTGVDQFGRDQSTGPGIADGTEHLGTPHRGPLQHRPRPARQARRRLHRRHGGHIHRSISTTSTSAMPTAARRRSGPMARTLAWGNSKRTSFLKTSRSEPLTSLKSASDDITEFFNQEGQHRDHNPAPFRRQVPAADGELRLSELPEQYEKTGESKRNDQE